MWKAFLTLTLASHCLAAPQHSSPQAPTTPQEKGSNPDDCECVPYYQCYNGTIITNGYGLIEQRTIFDDHKTTNLAQRNGKPCTDAIEVCCKPPDRLQKIKSTGSKGCGKPNRDLLVNARIEDANNQAIFGEFPWMVAIMKKDQKEEFIYQCGGSLIHNKAVLTIAHCVYGKEESDLKIRAGEWNLSNNDEILRHQERNVQKVIIHAKFRTEFLNYDIAILILSEPVEFAANVDIVCLPDPNVIYDGSRCIASGWGKDKYGYGVQYREILKKVELPVVPRDTCETNLQNTILGKYFKLHESFICAGGESGKDTCEGDGGSPLVCPSKKDPTRYEQAGIVAWGIGCGKNATPGVYSNVAYMRDWIDHLMAFYNLDNTVYNL